MSDAVEWVLSNIKDFPSLSKRAVVAGLEGHDGTSLWIIRAHFEGDLIPGKLAIEHNAAFVPWGGNEHAVDEFEVCCADVKSKLQWIEDKYGHVPTKAIKAGNTRDEDLYVGRVWHEGALVPGKVHPTHNTLYISFAGKEFKYDTYEVLCNV